jgi:hypothetical protein
VTVCSPRPRPRTNPRRDQRPTGTLIGNHAPSASTAFDPTLTEVGIVSDLSQRHIVAGKAFGSGTLGLLARRTEVRIPPVPPKMFLDIH